MRQFRYAIRKGRTPYAFDVIVWAATEKAANIQAAEIGFALGMLLIGPR